MKTAPTTASGNPEILMRAGGPHIGSPIHRAFVSRDEWVFAQKPGSPASLLAGVESANHNSKFPKQPQ